VADSILVYEVNRLLNARPLREGSYLRSGNSLEEVAVCISFGTLGMLREETVRGASQKRYFYVSTKL
jgi:hypothetical protein